ncbi:MAG: glycosyltransferase [Pseudomonadaceae bacterium]|nr:glycosyltransferase [Pseudomonadaceae bacterium]
MADRPAVTLVLPVLNNLSGLKRALASVTSVNVQIVVVDGGSSDGSYEYLASQVCPELVVVRQRGIGIAAAFNEGISCADGSYVCCMGSDDVWTEELNAFVSSLGSFPSGDVDIFFGATRFRDEEQPSVCRVRHPKPSLLWFRMWVFHSAMIVSKETYANVGVYDTNYALAMDSNWVHRAMRAGITYSVSNEVWSEVALGGRSDRHYASALREYRKSLIETGLTNPVVATAGYLAVRGLKTLAGIFRP